MQTSNNTLFYSLLIIVLASFAVGILTQVQQVHAGSEHSLRGWAWIGGASSPAGYAGLGWVGLNSLDDGSSANYGVDVPPTDGDLSGYAWSPYVGWISFEGEGCSSGDPRRTGNSIMGGAQILSLAGNAGNTGYDGCIDLDLTINDGNVTGYSWSDDLGWVWFGGWLPSAELTGNDCDISAGYSTCQGSFTWSIQNASNPEVYNTTRGQLYSTELTGNNVLRTIDYGANTVVARDGATTLKEITVTAECAGGSTWDTTNALCVADTGVCGSATDQAHTAAPTSNLCADGTTLVDMSMKEITAGWEWQCAGASADPADTVSCVAPAVPDIKIEGTPDLIRSGQEADLEVTITADWDLSCEILNAKKDPISIDHFADPSQQTYSGPNIRTRPLIHAQIVTLTCPYPARFDGVSDAATSTRINVVPTYEEI